MANPAAQTCPECGGAMREEALGAITCFCCHIGHKMTAEVLAATQLEVLQNSLSGVLRLLNERAAHCRDMAERCRRAGRLQAADGWHKAAEETQAREAAAREVVRVPWKHPEEVD